MPCEVSPAGPAQMSRRHFVSMGGAGAVALTFGGVRSLLPAVGEPSRFRTNPFTLGVASGDPEPDGVVLWTRLAPHPLQGGGMRPRPVNVRWEVAEDERWRRVVGRGEAIARPEEGHSVHVEVVGLRPGREYFYRFIAGGEESATGRTRTAPARGSDAAVRFAVASLPALRARPLHRLQAHGRGGPGPGAAPGRLHLRVRPRGLPGAERGGAHLRRRRAHHARRAIATATPSTSWTPTSRPPTTPRRGWSPGTTTRCRTTTPA